MQIRSLNALLVIINACSCPAITIIAPKIADYCIPITKLLIL